MLKLILKIVTVAFLLLSNTVNAQDFQGIATYQTKRSFDFDVKKDSTKSDKKSMINDDMKKQIREMLLKQSEKTYTLVFNKTSSLYTQDEELEKPKPSSSGFSFSFNGSPDVLFKNTKEKTYTKSTEAFGKKFLIKDTLQALDWKMEKESKKIGKYLCFKATATKLVDDYDFKTMKNKEKQKELKFTAWYAPEIPVNNGPSNITGLPGLILELHENKMQYVCTKLILNPKEKIEIKAPTKGKEISNTDFEAMQREKSKEMMKQFKGGRKKGDNSRVFMIGG